MVSLMVDEISLILEMIKLMSPLKVTTTLLSEERNHTISTAIQAKLQWHFQPDVGRRRSYSNRTLMTTKHISKLSSTMPQRLLPASEIWLSWMTVTLIFMKITAEVNGEVRRTLSRNNITGDTVLLS